MVYNNTNSSQPDERNKESISTNSLQKCDYDENCQEMGYRWVSDSRISSHCATKEHECFTVPTNQTNYCPMHEIETILYEITDSGFVEDTIDELKLDKDKVYQYLKKQEAFIRDTFLKNYALYKKVIK